MKTRSSITRLVTGVIGSVTLAVALAACGGGSGSSGQPAASPDSTVPGGSHTVQIKQFRYQPGKVEITAGTTVTWRNEDAILHTVTAGTPGQAKGDFDKELADKGTAASVTFDSPGTFTYFCSRHPEAMRAEITVKG